MAGRSKLCPSPNLFHKVIGLTNRPLVNRDALLPISSRLELYSGLDLTQDLETVVRSLRGIVGIQDVTHVYFTAYTSHGASYEELKRANVEILEHAVKAVDELCPNGYGLEFADMIDIKPPLKETLPRIPEPWYQNIFYYAQYDLLERLSEGKKWEFTEIRPDAIINQIGFVPNNNAMNLAQGLGLFLAMYRSIEGAGSAVPFPGNPTAYRALHTDTSQDILARFHIHCSLNSGRTKRKAFNIADGATVSWEDIWGGLCQFFGLKGAAPDPSHKKPTGAEWMHGHRPQWAGWVKKHGLKEGAIEGTSWEFMGGMMGAMTFDRQYDLSAAREIGFREQVDTVAGYHLAFARMREAKIIP
ncbi:MAG: hypothetical protein M1833_004176 [Piccolia ochrophora]|nr:MAG: hypothetical protein M1833_004176 [Piccolia ochrophora]